MGFGAVFGPKGTPELGRYSMCFHRSTESKGWKVTSGTAVIVNRVIGLSGDRLKYRRKGNYKTATDHTDPSGADLRRATGIGFAMFDPC